MHHQTDKDIDILVKSVKYQDGYRVAKQLKQVNEMYVSLRIVTELHVFNDGTQAKLTKLTGTIPISFQGCLYNTPIDIWIPLQFPNQQPMCYVVPSQQMEIRPNHQHVDIQGFIYHPFLAQWNKKCKLTDLINTLCHTFSVMPPLFAKPSLIKQQSLELSKEELQFINQDIQNMQLSSNNLVSNNQEFSNRDKVEKLVKDKLQSIYDQENEKLKLFADYQVNYLLFVFLVFPTINSSTK